MTLLSKNKSPEYNNLQSYSVFLRNILLSDHYISKKDYLKRYTVGNGDFITSVDLD